MLIVIGLILMAIGYATGPLPNWAPFPMALGRFYGSAIVFAGGGSCVVVAALEQALS